MIKNISTFFKKFINANFAKLLPIILLALFLRTYRISHSPARLTHDEMSIGYNAFSILETGRDEWGRFLPLDFEAFGDHKLPGYIYTLVPFLSFLPLDIVTVKIPSIIFGILIVWGVFSLTNLLFKNKRVSLLSALMVAISPWAVHISRMALESNLALGAFVWGLYFLFKSTNKKDKYSAYLAGILLGLSTYFYVAYRMISILILLIFLILSFVHKLDKKKVLFVFIFFGITILPIASEMIGKSGSARFDQVSIFSDNGIESTILEQNNFCFLSQPRILPKICKVVYNKPFLYAETFLKNYFSFLFPTFLFIEGDQLRYLGDPSFAEFYIFLAPFYLIGAYELFKKKGLKENLVKTAFLIAPIPSALVGDPQIVRGSALLIFIALFSANGIFTVFKSLKKKLIKNIYVLTIFSLVFIFLIRFFISYTHIYPGKLGNAFYPLSVESLQFLIDKEDEYDLISIDHTVYPDAHIFVSFSKKIDPVWYQENVVRPEKDSFGFSHPSHLGKYEFNKGIKELVNSYLCKENEQKVLFVSNNTDIKATWVFRDYSGVHKEAQVYDANETRDRLIKENLYKSTCAKFNKK